MQGDSRRVARGLRFLTLLEVVIQQGPEVVTAATEEGLREARLRKCQGQGLPLRSQPRVQGSGEGTDTLWQRKLQPATRKQMSGQLLKPSGQGKGSSPRSPWGGDRTPLRFLTKGRGRAWVNQGSELLLHTHAQLRGQGTVSQQRHVLPQPGVSGWGLDGQHLHTRAWLGSHCGATAASRRRSVLPAQPPPRPGALHAPNSDTFSHLASRLLSRSHSWHCLARRSQSLTCSTPMSRWPEGSVGCQKTGKGPPRWHHPPSSPWSLHSEGPQGQDRAEFQVGQVLPPPCKMTPEVATMAETMERRDGSPKPTLEPQQEHHLCTSTEAGPQRPPG